MNNDDQITLWEKITGAVTTVTTNIKRWFTSTGDVTVEINDNIMQPVAQTGTKIAGNIFEQIGKSLGIQTGIIILLLGGVVTLIILRKFKL
jgi:hypothetical protein